MNRTLPHRVCYLVSWLNIFVYFRWIKAPLRLCSYSRLSSYSATSWCPTCCLWWSRWDSKHPPSLFSTFCTPLNERWSEVSIMPKAVPRLTCYLLIAGSSLCEDIIQGVTKHFWPIYCEAFPSAGERNRQFHFSVGREKSLTHLRSRNGVFVINSRKMFSPSPFKMFCCCVPATMITKVPIQ